MLSNSMLGFYQERIFVFSSHEEMKNFDCFLLAYYAKAYFVLKIQESQKSNFRWSFQLICII